MPTYEYACTNCKHEFERFESITAKPDRSCPKCNKKKAERRISGGGGFLFKGTGFYVTDYKKSSGTASSTKTDSKPAESTSCCAGGACSAHTAKTESKSESKSTSKKTA